MPVGRQPPRPGCDVTSLAVRRGPPVAVRRNEPSAVPRTGTPGVRGPRRPVRAHRTRHVDRSRQPRRLDPGRVHALPPRPRRHRHADRLPAAIPGPARPRPSRRVHGLRPRPRSPARPHRPAQLRPRRARLRSRRARPPPSSPRRRTPRSTRAATAAAGTTRRPAAGHRPDAVRAAGETTPRWPSSGRRSEPAPAPSAGCSTTNSA